MAAEEPMETTDSTVDGSVWGKDAWMAATEGEMMESNRDMIAKAMIPTRTPRFRLVNPCVLRLRRARGRFHRSCLPLNISGTIWLMEGSLLQQQCHANQHDEKEQIKNGIDFQVTAFLARILLDYSLVGDQRGH